MSRAQSAGDLQRESEFEGFMLDVMRHLVIEMEAPGANGTGVALRLSPSYRGERMLEECAKRWDVKRWTPLLLARALADIKGRFGGSAGVVSIGPDFIEMAQTKCEFGEPRDSRYRGNLCGVCSAVLSSITGASGIVDPERSPEVATTIAQGSRACQFKLALA